MKKFLRNNSLTIVFLLMFIISLFLQSIAGFKQYNQKQEEEGAAKISYVYYFSTGHFIEATFENWESEFLQMAMFVTLSMFLYQKGSSQSKDPDKKEEVEKEPDASKADAPWPVKHGGFVLSLYKHSLSYMLFLLFFLSFLMHWYGSLKGYNHQQILKGLPTQTAFQFLGNSKLWFESFENWQSEFLSVVSLAVLSIYFRQRIRPNQNPLMRPIPKQAIKKMPGVCQAFTGFISFFNVHCCGHLCHCYCYVLHREKLRLLFLQLLLSFVYLQMLTLFSKYHCCRGYHFDCRCFLNFLLA